MTRKGNDARPRWAASSKARLDLERIPPTIPSHQGLTLSFRNTTQNKFLFWLLDFDEIEFTRALQWGLLHQEH